MKKKLKAMNVNKSPNPDGHHPVLLKELADELALALAIVCQKSLSEGCLPQEWKDAHISPIFKKGKKSVPGNYRPVSLTSIICKVIESLFQDHVVHHITSKQLLTDNQHGFIHGHSCATNILAVFDAWTEATDMGLAVDAIYLDFAKAFDMVPHQRLITKLESYGVRGTVAQWIQQFLAGR